MVGRCFCFLLDDFSYSRVSCICMQQILSRIKEPTNEKKMGWGWVSGMELKNQIAYNAQRHKRTFYFY